jgi:hypothetical protein
MLRQERVYAVITNRVRYWGSAGLSVSRDFVES